MHSTESDEELMARLEKTLGEHAADGDPYSDDGEFARNLESLPPGLRAMAATHFLDMSMSMDYLSWHFLNFGKPGLVRATEAGLRELGLEELAGLFGEAAGIMAPLRQEITNADQLDDVLERHGKLERLEQLHRQADLSIHDDSREQFHESTIYGAWLRYARERPERVFPGGGKSESE